MTLRCTSVVVAMCVRACVHARRANNPNQDREPRVLTSGRSDVAVQNWLHRGWNCVFPQTARSTPWYNTASPNLHTTGELIFDSRRFALQ